MIAHSEDMTTRADKKRTRWMVFSVAFAVFMVRLDGYVVNISLPTLARYFQVGANEVSWVVLSYLLIMTGSTLIFGKLVDRLGLKKIFLGGYGLFTLGSLLCGLAPTILLLNAARALQGAGGAMMVTAGMAGIPHYLPKNIVGWAFGICSLANSLGIMVGAPLGGLITGFFSWRWIFLINIPVGFLALIIAMKNLPPDRRRYHVPAIPSFDVTGSLLSFIGLSALVFAFSMGNDMGWTDRIIVIAMTVGIVSLVAFFFHEQKTPDPILNLTLFRDWNLTLAITITSLALMLLAGGNFLVPFYLEIVKGLRPEHVGAVVMIYSLVYMPIGPYAGKLSDRVDPRRLCTLAMALAFVACILFAFTIPEPGLWPAVIYLVLLAVAYAFFFPANNNLVMSLAPPESQGAAAAIYNTVMNVGMVFGVCLFEGSFSQSLPPGLSIRDLHEHIGDDTMAAVSSSFQGAFFIGAFFSLAALALSFLSGRWRSAAARRR